VRSAFGLRVLKIASSGFGQTCSPVAEASSVSAEFTKRKNPA
jgi:hypothetical protein